MVILADAVENAPWWITGATACISIGVGIGYGVIRLIDRWKKKKNEWAKLDHAHEIEVRKELTAEQKEVKRDSEAEAWKIVDRLDKEVKENRTLIQTIQEEYETRISEIEERERKCAQDRIGDRMVLKILANWATNQKNPPPIPKDVLDSILQDDTKPHKSLNTEGDKTK